MSNIKGNALFLILIAVALFAALGYAVTQSNRGSGSSDKEDAALVAAKLFDYAAQAEFFISRAMLIENVQEWEFSQRRPGLAPADVCARVECEIYNYHLSYGGIYQTQGLDRLTLPAKFLIDPAKASTEADADYWHGRFLTLRVQGVGTDAADILFNVEYIDENLCREINKRAGLTDTYPLESFNMNVYAQVASTVLEPALAGNNNDYIGDEVTELAGKSTFCVVRSLGPSPMFLHVVLAR